MSDDYHLDALEYAVFHTPRRRKFHGLEKLVRWLTSRPFARVRRNLATQRRVAEDEARKGTFEEVYARAFPQQRATLYDGPIWPEVPGGQREGGPIRGPVTWPPGQQPAHHWDGEHQRWRVNNEVLGEQRDE